MKIVVDTNVIMDILLRREPFFGASYGAVKHVTEQGDACMVSASAVADIYDLLCRAMKDEAQAKQALERLLQLVHVADVLGIDIQTALSSYMHDFEDAVVHAVAVRNCADMILTRNVKDFTDALVEVVAPADYLLRFAE